MSIPTTVTIKSIAYDSAATTTGLWVTVLGIPSVGFAIDETVSLLGDVFDLSAEL